MGTWGRPCPRVEPPTAPGTRGGRPGPHTAVQQTQPPHKSPRTPEVQTGCPPQHQEKPLSRTARASQQNQPAAGSGAAATRGAPLWFAGPRALARLCSTPVLCPHVVMVPSASPPGPGVCRQTVLTRWISHEKPTWSTATRGSQGRPAGRCAGRPGGAEMRHFRRKRRLDRTAARVTQPHAVLLCLRVRLVPWCLSSSPGTEPTTSSRHQLIQRG